MANKETGVPGLQRTTSCCAAPGTQTCEHGKLMNTPTATRPFSPKIDRNYPKPKLKLRLNDSENCNIAMLGAATASPVVVR